MQQIRFGLRLCPRSRWERLQRLPKPCSWISGRLLLKRDGGEKGKKRKKEKSGKRKRGNEKERGRKAKPTIYISNYASAFLSYPQSGAKRKLDCV